MAHSELPLHPPRAPQAPRRSWRSAFTRRRSAAALLVTVAVAASACGATDAATGSEPSASPASSAATFPVTVSSGPSASPTPVTIAERPDAVVSLSPTATEVLWAIGADDQVVAVDDQSDYPVGVPTTKLSGFQPNVEAILGYSPDLVVASDDMGGLVAGLTKAKVPVLLLPAAATLDEAYGQWERLGAATGNVTEAAALVADTKKGVADAVASVPASTPRPTYFHELDPTLYTVTSTSFIGQVYGLLGMRSIADAAGKGDAYPQLSKEYVVQADPGVIALADSQCCGVTPAAVAARPGWSGLSAVKAGRVIVLDEDVASRWGPRVVDFARTLAGVLTGTAPAGASGSPAASPTASPSVSPSPAGTTG